MLTNLSFDSAENRNFIVANFKIGDIISNYRTKSLYFQSLCLRMVKASTMYVQVADDKSNKFFANVLLELLVSKD